MYSVSLTRAYYSFMKHFFRVMYTKRRKRSPINEVPLFVRLLLFVVCYVKFYTLCFLFYSYKKNVPHFPKYQAYSTPQESHASFLCTYKPKKHMFYFTKKSIRSVRVEKNYHSSWPEVLGSHHTSRVPSITRHQTRIVARLRPDKLSR